ncbi:cell wall hydrolase [Sphingobium sp.]|uniref:cell wall hydrolase n=1 Tax=Sphingobium sp. TaxID=1912891 RepID=UPI003BB7DE55
MTRPDSVKEPHPAMWLVWLLLFAGLPALVAGWEARDRPDSGVRRFAAAQAARLQAPPTPPPPVEPVEVYALDRDQARAFNAKIPFSPLPNPAARPFVFAGSEVDLARAIDCLAAAQIYEAGDDAVGERAVAQVVLNRVRHPAFPKTVCAVVFQGQERRTGCQFTFTCDGALARTPSPAVWDRAREIARGALAGKVFPAIGYATHYHTNWVVPYWSDSLDKLTMVGTHLFFRWRGWWGTPPAFRRGSESGEPVIAQIARLSAAHRPENETLTSASTAIAAAMASSAELAAQAPMAIGPHSVGKVIAGGRLIATDPDGVTFMVEVGRTTASDSWLTIAHKICGGRPLCRVMVWRGGSAPAAWPPSTAQIETMSFGYIHNLDVGLQRALWNCTQTPRAAKSECMRQRVPTGASAAPMGDAGLDGVRRRGRFETVKIVPPAPTPPPAPSTP